MITFDSSFTNACKNANGQDIGYIVDIYYNDDTTYYRFSTHDFILTSGTSAAKAVYGCVKSISDITSTIDPHDCSYSVSNCTVTLAEGIIGFASSPTGSVTSLIAPNGKGLRNRKIEIKYYLKNTGYTAGASFPTIFEGLILNFAFDDVAQLWTFDCISKKENIEKELPQTTVTRSNYPNCPDSSIGVPIPLVYGFFIQSDYTATLNNPLDVGIHHQCPSVCVDDTNGKYLFASHALHIVDDDNINIFFDELNTYGLNLTSNVPTNPTTSASGASVTLPTDFVYLLVNQIYLIPKFKGSHNDISDTSNIFDANADTYTNIATSGSDKILSVHFQGLNSSTYFPATAAAGDVVLRTYFNSYSGTANNVKFFIYNASEYLSGTLNGTGVKTANMGNPTNRTDRDSGAAKASNAQWTWDEFARYQYGIKVSNGTTVDVNFFSFTLANVRLAVTKPLYIAPPQRSGASYVFTRGQRGEYNGVWNLTVDKIESSKSIVPTKARAAGADRKLGISSVFCDRVHGREYGAWAGGGRFLMDTGDTTGDPIITAPYVIESILRDELSVSGSDIDYAYLDALTSANFGSFDFSLNEFTSAKDLITQLSFYNNIVTYLTSDGKFKFYYFEDTPASSTLDLYEDQIKIKKVYWTSPDLLCNKVTINYTYDYATQRYLQTYTNQDTTSQGTTYQGENRTVEKVFDCGYFRSCFQSTNNGASLFADKFLAIWKDPHLLVDFDLLDVSKFCLQEGDVVTFNNMTFNPMGMGQGSSTDYWSSFDSPRTKYFLIISCTRSLDRGVVSYTGFQLHNL